MKSYTSPTRPEPRLVHWKLAIFKEQMEGQATESIELKLPPKIIAFSAGMCRMTFTFAGDPSFAKFKDKI